MGSPSRRDRGHEKLAWRRVCADAEGEGTSPLPDSESGRRSREQRLFVDRLALGLRTEPMALMDAGVDDRAVGGGVARGLIKEGDRFAVPVGT